jgi:hypothetical protein
MATPLPADPSKVDPVEAWMAWFPTADEPWDRKRIAHLYRRGAFGATPADIDRALVLGYSKTLDRLLQGDGDGVDFEFLTEVGRSLKAEPDNFRVWWLRAMLESGHPLREKLTLFWHNHFATSYAKVGSSALMFEQNLTLRKHALGKFRPFLLEMSKDPAMLKWLDSNQNVKGAPNENYAREVMELFSLGVGNYTEKDIREAARAFTGWHYDTRPNEDVEEFAFKPDEHDDGMKTVFGKTGNWNGDDIVRLCCDQPACAKFLVGKLYSFLVSEAPPPKGLLTPLEERFRKTDYDIADLVRTMLSSRYFFSRHAYHKRVKWPVEYTLEAIHSLTPGQVPLGELIRPLAKMGQVLFSPPNVKGWRTGTDWLNSATLLARNNFGEKVAMGTWSQAGSNPQNPDTGPFSTEAAVVSPPAELVPYPETASAAVAGFAAASTAPVEFQNPDGEKLITRRPGGEAPNSLPPGASPGAPPSTAGAPPAPPQPQHDPVVVLYAAKPKDVHALVEHMSEVLYGDRISPAHVARIEKFLLAPLMPVQQNVPAPKGPRNKTATVAPEKPVGPPPAKEPEKKGSPVVKKGGPPDLQSPDFKARVREALHAMMCLPEYQLN